ncbi:MAG: hypothetical protein GXP26_07205 [Planctomycetes bacterium]|nr:hypothetical protein [Planctomycetota bacterium]
MKTTTTFTFFSLAGLLVLVTADPAFAVVKLGVMGDSLSDEYFEDSYSYAENWTVQLVEHRGIDMGPTGVWGEPRRNGYEYNWARAGATSADVIVSGQDTGLAAQIVPEGIEYGVLMIGSNDQGSEDAYINIHDGTWSPAQINAWADGIATNIAASLDTVLPTGVKMVVTNSVDYGITPSVNTNGDVPNAAGRQAVSDVLRTILSPKIEAVAAARNLPYLDLAGAMDTVFGPQTNLNSTLTIGGVDIFLQEIDDPNGGNPNPDAGFVDDGIHPNTSIQGLFANLVMESLNVGYGANLSLFSEEEIVTHAGLTYGGSDTLFPQIGNYSDYVTNYNSAPITQSVIFSLDTTQSTVSLGGPTILGDYGPQSPGSDITPVKGHFLVEFDPTSASPPTIRFVGGHGFIDAEVTGNWLPGPNVETDPTSITNPAPADLAIQTPGGEVQWAERDFVWDWASEVVAIDPMTNSIDATDTRFIVLSLKEEVVDRYSCAPAICSDSYDFEGLSENLTSGSWTLVESAPGSGEWTLSLAGTYLDSANRIWSFDLTSTAQFGGENIETLGAADTTAEILGGAGVVGGVSLEFAAPTTGGSLTAQQIPFAGLTPEAIEAAAQNGQFVATTAAMEGDLQIWDVDFTGDLAGSEVALVFAYDEAPFVAAGIDESSLGIWHYSSSLDAWEFGGVVDPVANTITFTTSSFSPFVVGVAVPEPSCLALGSIGLFAMLGSVRKRCSTGGCRGRHC